ncbi:MAG: hypothetical protein AAB389_02320 [Patescibacteria group bacterium]
MGNKNPKVVINGFGSADLIKKLEKAKWSANVPGMPALRTFLGISLAGMRLTSPGDIFSFGRFSVTVENSSTGKRFEVKGFTTSDVVAGLQANPQIVIGQDALRLNYIKHYCRFRVTVERIK